ncbi:MAG: efflux RND transporter permease subunit [Fibrobacterales bacterium]|nr:efflux RND transporter permease subunit [Fibrobacterales bacterium]
MERLKSLLQSLPAATVAHPWTAHLLMAAVLAGGWFCGSGLRTSLLPEQEPDRVTVELSWPGALPEEIEREAVVPLEERIAALPRVRSRESVSMPGGARLSVRAKSARQADRLAQEIREVVGTQPLPPGCAATKVEREPFSMPGAVFLVKGESAAEALPVADEFKEMLRNEFGLSDVRIDGAPIPFLPPESPLGKIRYDGKEVLAVSANQSRGEDLLRVAKRAHDGRERFLAKRPGSVEVFYDGTSVLGDRMSLLGRNGLQGLCLVLVVLALFLNLRVAFWVALSLPFAVSGMMVLARATGMTFNLLSLFGMIAVVGMLVDSAIVVAERVWQELEAGAAPAEAARTAVRKVFAPVTASTLTTIAVFVPFFFFRGMIGSMVWQIAVVAIAALVFSLVESFLVLPAHLAHVRRRSAFESALSRSARMRAEILRRVHRIYGPALRFALDHKALALAVPLLGAALTALFFQTGVLQVNPYQETDDEIPGLEVTMPAGTPAETTDSLLAAVEERIRAAVAEMERESGGAVLKGTMRSVGANRIGDAGPHAGRIVLRLVSGRERPLPSEAVVQRLRRALGRPDGVARFRFGSAGQWGAPVSIALRGADYAELHRAADDLRREFEAEPTVVDPVDDYVEGTTPTGSPCATIRRADGAREIVVEASLAPGASSLSVQRLVQNELLPRVLARHPGVDWRPGAQQRDNIEFAVSIALSFTPALLLILLMLLAEFRSLKQSAVVLVVIPLGVLGGLWGHVIHGEMVSNMSVFGFVALSGVVVNNAIIFVDSINRLRREGLPLREATVAGSLSRLRPIAMTTFTTVAGLMPMMLERSFQAKEMVPMAFTVCWGLLFGSLMALFATPVLVEWLALRESRSASNAAK